MWFVDICCTTKEESNPDIVAHCWSAAVTLHRGSLCKETVGGGWKSLEEHSGLWQTLCRLMSGDGVDSESDSTRCWEAPITWTRMHLENIEGVGNMNSHLTATECQCAVPCSYTESK